MRHPDSMHLCICEVRVDFYLRYTSASWLESDWIVYLFTSLSSLACLTVLSEHIVLAV